MSGPVNRSRLCVKGLLRLVELSILYKIMYLNFLPENTKDKEIITWSGEGGKPEVVGSGSLREVGEEREQTG